MGKVFVVGIGPGNFENIKFFRGLFHRGMVLQNAGSPGGRAYPIAFLRWPGTAHPAAQRPRHHPGGGEEIVFTPPPGE